MGYVIVGAVTVVTAGGMGTYAYFRGQKLVENILDRILTRRAKKQAGFYRTINPNEWCPACGAKQGEIFWNPNIRKVVHNCNICNAAWPELPRIKQVDSWDFLGRDLAFAGERKEDIEAVLARANAPIKLGEKKESEVVN